METGVDLPEPAQLHPGVDLGRGDGRMAQHLLDRPQVGSAGQQVRGEAVPERMRADLPLQSGRRACCLTIRQRPIRESGRPDLETSTVAVSGCRADQVGAILREIAREGLDRPRTERDPALLVTLADAPGQPLRGRGRAGLSPTTSEARQPVA